MGDRLVVQTKIWLIVSQVMLRLNKIRLSFF